MAKRIDIDALAKMYLAGDKLDDICRTLNCARSSAKAALTRMGVPRRPRGWKPAGFAETVSRSRRAYYAKNPRWKNPDAKRNRGRYEELLQHTRGVSR